MVHTLHFEAVKTMNNGAKLGLTAVDYLKIFTPIFERLLGSLGYIKLG